MTSPGETATRSMLKPYTELTETSNSAKLTLLPFLGKGLRSLAFPSLEPKRREGRSMVSLLSSYVLMALNVSRKPWTSFTSSDKSPNLSVGHTHVPSTSLGQLLITTA